MLVAPDQADRVFYGSTGRPLVTTSDVAAIVREIVAGSDVSVGDELSESERPVVATRGQLSIENARAQFGWEPEYGSVRDGIRQYADHYAAFLAASR